ncbi:MAG: hypothetical protein Kow0074_17680 [Candidatus Zixiibacteriota bacterium]
MAEGTITLLTAVAMLIGLAMFFSARFFKTAEAPRGYTWNPKKWTPIWKQREWFRPPGFALMMAGYAIFAVAFILRLILLP